MNSRDSLDQTPDSIDLTESPVKHTNTQRHIEKINEDTSDYDTDEKIDFDNDKAKKTYRKDTNECRKRARIMKTKKVFKCDEECYTDTQEKQQDQPLT